MIDYLATYRQSFFELGKHICLYGICLYNTCYFKDNILSLVTVPILGLMNMRNFIIFHDCGHNSYTPDAKMNYILGNIFSFIVCTPYNWNFLHHNHHLTNGNKNNKYNHNFNETILYTKQEYESLSIIYKYLYRIIRDPLIFFTIIPLIKFTLLNKIEMIYEIIYEIIYDDYIYKYKESKILRLNNIIINLIGDYIVYCYLDYLNILYHFSCAFMIGVSLGFMLFHCQHTYNPGYIVTDEKWNKKDSGLKGSSFILVPRYLKYFTMGIEYHHIHHMNAKIPGYNLERYHNKNYKDDETITKLSIKDCYNNLWLTLYDEKTKKYVSF